MHHVSRFLPAVLAGFSSQRHAVRGGRVVIESLSEDRVVLVGLLRQAAEAGLIGSMDEISEVCLNGRRIPVVGR